MQIQSKAKPRAYPPLKIRPDSGAFLDAIKEVTGLPKVEIARQAVDLFFGQLPSAQKNKVSNIYSDLLEALDED